MGSVTGAMWESEHGPSGGDEINIVERGKKLRVGRRVEGAAERHDEAIAARHGRTADLLHAGARSVRPWRFIPAIDFRRGGIPACSSREWPGTSCFGSRS